MQVLLIFPVKNREIIQKSPLYMASGKSYFVTLIRLGKRLPPHNFIIWCPNTSIITNS